MKISESFYGELREEDELVFGSSGGEQPDRGDPEFIRRFFDTIGQWRREDLSKRRTQGLCMTPAQFEALQKELLDLTGRIGLDIESDIVNGVGFAALVFHHFDLHKAEDPELLASLALSIQRADYLHVGICEKYGDKLIKLTLQYDLTE